MGQDIRFEDVWLNVGALESQEDYDRVEQMLRNDYGFGMTGPIGEA